MNIRLFLLSACLVCCPALPLFSQEKPSSQDADAAQKEEKEKFVKLIKSIDWTTDGSGNIGSIATLKVPGGYRYTAGAGTIKLMQAYGNLTSNRELGYVTPDDMKWFAVFEFDDCGYVKDDEKGSLDADKILDQLKEGQKEANKELAKRGMPTLELLGWQTPPFYNPQTHNLEWALRLRSGDGSEVVNYKTKLLGRHGVMDVVLVCDEKGMPTIVPEYQALLEGFSFKKEESYASFTKGDKIAEYGLTGLIVGGALLAAAKSGLLAKLWKPLVIGIAAIGTYLKRLFKGKNKDGTKEVI